ncbi:Pr6Pr family membrane protein [Planomonospora sp. ID82291]|uniref:Pr6Pr family membrane protein n=1 Tax=Planomonospora sp. ID82291 TaxID=2738136 RepID=UPI0018C39ABD|nr:Pr6Pr family membrane protein [Planomonospora sp. ID82291]MBG0813825.1 Pr6Pr family membrane protein [Planomonospora sp. ID82291]
MNGTNAYRVVLVAAGLAGLLCTWLAATDPLNPPVYFTVQSNIMLVAYHVWQLSGRGVPSAFIKGAVTLFISITGLVAHFILTHGASPLLLLPDGQGNDVQDMGNLLLHYVTPIMAFADWLLFDRALRPGWSRPLVWLAYPAAYLVFALTRGALLAPGTERRYPYPFLDVDRLGYDGVALQAVLLTAGFAVLGYLLVALHRLVSRTATPRPAEESRALP